MPRKYMGVERGRSALRWAKHYILETDFDRALSRPILLIRTS